MSNDGGQVLGRGVGGWGWRQGLLLRREGASEAISQIALVGALPF